MKTILVVDDVAFCREMISEVLTARGYGCVTAADGKLAWEVLQARPIELMICDLAMPNIDGASLVRLLRSNPRFARLPIVMLTAAQQREQIMQTVSLGVRDYLLKSSFSLTELLSRVAKLIGPPPVQAAEASVAIQSAPEPKAEPTEALLSTPAAPAASKATSKVFLPKLVDGKAISAAAIDWSQQRALGGVVMELVRLTSTPETSTAEITRTLEQDAVLSARVLQVANSTGVAGGMAAARNRSTSLDEAVRRLGLSELKTLISTAAVFKDFKGVSDPGGLLQCWQHSLAVATVLEKLVPNNDTLAKGTAYIVGLCSNVGEMLLRQRFPHEFAAANQYAEQAGTTLPQIQSGVLSLSALQLTREILQGMNLPPLIAEPILAFWADAGGDATALTSSTVSGVTTLATALKLANSFATAMQIESPTSPTLTPLTQAEHRSTMLSTSSLNTAEIRSETLMTIVQIAGANAEEQTALMTPKAMKRNVAIGYVRHPSISGVDPLETALTQLAEVRSSTAMLRGNDLANLKAMVVAVPRVVTDGFAPGDLHRLLDSVGLSAIPVLYITMSSADDVGPLSARTQVIRTPLTLDQLSGFIANC